MPRGDPIDELREKLQRLEARNTDLEARFSHLEGQVKQNSKLLSWLDDLDRRLELEDKGQPVRALPDGSTVRKLPKAAGVGISDTAPAVVWTSRRDPKLDKQLYKYDGTRGAPPAPDDYRKRLVAPMAGFLSAGLEITVVWPSEYAKVQLQLNRANPDFKILQHMSSRGLSIYKGLAPMLIGAPLQGMMRFGSLDFFNNMLRDPETGKVGRASGLLAGISAGIMEAIVVVTPMETIKTRLVESGKGITDGVKYVVRQQGIGGLYKGLVPTMGKSASNQALRFFIFNEYKRIIIGDRPVHELSSLESLAGGMTAGCLGAMGNTPFDTVKTRMQGLEAGRYKGLFDCARSMVMHEGVFSLWKGLGARLMRVVPGQGIIFCSYESICNFLQQRIA